MATWTGAILGESIGDVQGLLTGDVQGLLTGTASMVTGRGFAKGYGEGQQVWMSMGDVTQTAICNYDAVEPGSVQKGDMMVMSANMHTILVLFVNKNRFAVYEHGRGGPARTVYKGDSAWKELRNHTGEHNYILHHIKANETEAHLDEVFERLKPKYFKNCHVFVDDMLKTAAARMRNF